MNCEDITRFDLDMDGSFEPSEHGSWVRYEDHVLLLAAQRQWVGLTDEEISACDPHEDCWGLHEAVRRAEAKLREKNGGGV